MNFEFKHEFSKKILNRGYEYYKSNLVNNVKIDGNKITATVSGSTDYDVVANIIDGTLLNAECTCPYYDTGDYCKHIAALLYYLNNEDLTDLKVDSNKEVNFLNILDKIANNELKEFLSELLLSDKNLLDKFRLKFNNYFPNLTLKEFKQKINGAIINSGGRDGFIDYEKSWDYENAMYEIINEIAKVIDNENYDLAFDSLAYLLDTIPDTDIDDSNGSTSSIADNCIDKIKDIFYKTLNKDSNLTKKIFSYLSQELKTRNLDNYGVDLYKLLDDFVETKTFLPEIEQILISTLDKNKEKNCFWSKKYYIEQLMIIYEINNKKDEILDLLYNYSTDEKIFLMLIDELIGRKKISVVVELIKERMSANKDDNYKNRSLAYKLMEIYYDESMIEEYLDILYKIFYYYDKYDLTIFKKIKDWYPKDEWLVISKEIIEKVEKENTYSSYDALNKLYIEECLFDKLFTSVKNNSMDNIIKYEKYLLPKYNDELIDIYINYCKSFADKANNRKLYNELANKLSHIKNMDNSKDKFDIILSEIRQVHKGKPAMQEILQVL